MTRRRLLALLAGLVLALAAAVVVVALATDGGGGPPTGAAALVPGDALAYVHVWTDGRQPPVRRGLALARELPSYATTSQAILGRVAAVAAGTPSASYGSDISPWLGHEAALAVLDTPTSTATSLIVLDVASHARATDFVHRFGALAAGTYRAHALLRYPNGTQLAFLAHYLVVGEAAAVRASIDAHDGGLPSLARTPGYTAAAAGAPADRVLDLYASAAGLRRLLGSRSGALGAALVLFDQPTLSGSDVSLSPAAAGLRVRLHSALDPNLASVGCCGTRQFNPSLPQAIPASATLMLDVGDLHRVAPTVLRALSLLGIGGRLAPLLSRLGGALASEGVALAPILAIFGAETAVALVPGGRSGPPSLLLVTHTADEQRTRAQLAALELPLEQLFPAPPSGGGQAPLTNDLNLHGVSVRQVGLTPGLQVDYTVHRGLVIVSTSARAIGELLAGQGSLSGLQAYKVSLGAGSGRVTSLLFADFNQLLNLAEESGLARGARLQALRADLLKVHAVGLRTTRGESDTTAEMYLQIPLPTSARTTP